jgi:sirohydrochlorin cobaltochelatase
LKAIVLFAHGSRDPLWRVPIESIAQRIQDKDPSQLVGIAYLELNEPDLKTCVATLVSQGAREIKLFPLFLGVGKHARQDLPLMVEEVKTLHPQLQIKVLPSAGEMPEVVDFLAQLALN